MIWKGGKMLYDDLVRVPFIVRDPRAGQGGTVNSHLVESVDIMPTVLDLAGVEHPAGIQGRSLLGHLRGSAADSWRTWAFAEGLTAKMIRDHRWKLIMYGGRVYGEMYDLRRDPDELDNLFDDPRYATVRAELMEQLVHKLIETEDPLPRPTIRPGYSEVTGRHGTDELT